MIEERPLLPQHVTVLATFGSCLQGRTDVALLYFVDSSISHPYSPSVTSLYQDNRLFCEIFDILHNQNASLQHLFNILVLYLAFLIG
jgi:hypothetical protein